MINLILFLKDTVMKNFAFVLLLILPIFANAGNIPKAFDSRPVFPTVEKMRNADWTWQNFVTLPNASKLTKDTQFKGKYSVIQTIREENPNTTITFYGTKERPEVAVIESRTWGAANTEKTLFVRLDMLKGNVPLKSNCNFKNISEVEADKDEDGHSYESGADLAFQQVYILPKSIAILSNQAAGKNDLYVASSQVETYVVTGSFQTQAYTLSIITPYKDKLGKYIKEFGWHTTKQGRKVNCSINYTL